MLLRINNYWRFGGLIINDFLSSQRELDLRNCRPLRKFYVRYIKNLKAMPFFFLHVNAA